MNAALQGKSVLIVEDMEKVYPKIKELYESTGMRVVGRAENGLVALDMIQELKPDLVSLDIVMPVMDGIECYRKIQKRIKKGKLPKSLKCLFLSCLSSEQKVISAFQREIPEQLFLSKYPSADQMATRINLVLNAGPIADADATAPQEAPKQVDSLLESDLIGDLKIKRPA